MAKFKVGDRVRVIVGGRAGPAGMEGVVVLSLGAHAGGSSGVERYGVELDGRPCPIGPGTHWLFLPSSLAPLVPPASDTWAADKVKQVTKPQHIEPVAPKTEVLAKGTEIQ